MLLGFQSSKPADKAYSWGSKTLYFDFHFRLEDSILKKLVFDLKSASPECFEVGSHVLLPNEAASRG
jgi:hypothetical protein